MSGNERHGRARYNDGCRCDVCKSAENDYRKRKRQEKAEAVGEFVAPVPGGLRLLPATSDSALTSVNELSHPEYSVVEGVLAEIEQFGGHRRPALANAALALAAVLDNPKAVSTKPAAAGKLSDLLEQMRKSADNKESRLSRVRGMTKPQVKTG